MIRSISIGALVVLAGAAHAQPVRPYDGLYNNIQNPEWGSVDARLVRTAPAEYADGASAPAGASRPDPRVISNSCADQGRDPIWSDRVLTSMTIFWGQFIDHDIGLTEPPEDDLEPLMIAVPDDDPFFDPDDTPVLPFLRSRYDHTTGTGPDNPREQINQISAYIDGSAIYGDSPERAAALRTGIHGKLHVGPDNLLPLNTLGVGMANPFGVPDEILFAAGDVRGNENPALATLHTIFVREHNRRCDELLEFNPFMRDEELYQSARRWVGSIVQHITYNEFLPALLGPDAPGPYQGYDTSVNAGIANEFAHAAYRMGHTMVNPQLPRYDENGQPFGDGHLDLLTSFFNPAPVAEPGGLDAIVRGLTRTASQEIDMQIVDDLRNFLFPAGSGGMDLASVNIQRGRDHGLASYNAHRVAYGLPAAVTWSDVTSNTAVQLALADLYTSPDEADLWVVGLAEDHLPGASLGPTLTAIIADQFERLRDGDRYWYERIHVASELNEIRNTTLRDVIERNTGVTLLQPNVFFLSVDYNADGLLNLDDIDAFVNFFLATDPRADLNGDGDLNLDDIQIFVDAFFAYNG
ncbi:MAG: peroxidase family protein [Phycisphaerales bacterium]